MTKYGSCHAELFGHADIGDCAEVWLVHQDGGAAALFDYNQYIHHYQSTDIFADNHDFAYWQSSTGQDQHSTFDGSPLGDGGREELFYNDTQQTKTFNLGDTVYQDIYGEQVSGSLELEPFASKILVVTD